MLDIEFELSHESILFFIVVSIKNHCVCNFCGTDAMASHDIPLDLLDRSSA